MLVVNVENPEESLELGLYAHTCEQYNQRKIINQAAVTNQEHILAWDSSKNLLNKFQFRTLVQNYENLFSKDWNKTKQKVNMVCCMK